MTKIIKETITTKLNTGGQTITTPHRNDASGSQTAEYLIYFLFGLLETLLAFRFLFKLTGASLSSAFVRGIYAITGVFILPFEGIFRRGFTQGVETTAVLEPSTIVAFFVYILIAWGIVKLVKIFSGEKQQS